MKSPTQIIMAAALGFLAGCGDNDELTCAPGTFKNGSSCSAFDPDDDTAPVTAASPGSTRSRTLPGFVVLSAVDEPATIYYTTDGSDPDPTRGGGEPSPVIVPALTSGTTLKFFGVDAAGNREEMHTETYVADTKPPASIANLAIVTSGQTATVTWSNPTDADYTATLLARIATVADADPEPGTTYTAPSALSPSVQLVAVGTATQFSDPGLPTGPVRYVAWTVDDLGNYSTPTFAQADVGTVSTAATFTFDTSNSALVRTVTPASVDLTGTTADLLTGTVTLHLSIKNLTTTYFQNPKILVKSVTNATFSGATGTADTFAFKTIGPGFFAPAATKTVDLTFTGATGTVTIEIELGHHPSLIGGWHKGCCSAKPHQLMDLGSGLVSTGLLFSSGGRSPTQLGGVSRPGVLVSGHLYDVPTSEGTIERWDLAKMTRVGGANVGIGNRQIVMSVFGTGTQYSVLKSGGMRNGGQLKLLRFDESLRRTGTIDLIGLHGQGTSFAALSPDRSLIAVPAGLEVALVDTATFTQKDMNPATPLFDSLDTGLTDDDRVRSIAWLNDSSGFVAIGRDGDVSVVKLTATGYTATVTNLNSQGNAVVTAADGRVWIANDNGLRIYTPATDAITVSAYPHTATALTIVNGTLWVLRPNRLTLDSVDATGAVVRTLTFPQQAYGHWLKSTQ